ncbi:hypothetical protein [Iodidimonas sp. SYSU 1G8]|uniref:hypothetical protein n=1 Tax=Iodidimonas sp. SYSU 1G8 TaxID=3133967 RepID=UPI0031FE6FBF
MRIVPGEPADAAPTQDGALPPGGVYQRGLDSLDPSSPGTLTEGDGGLPRAMWDGSDRRTLVALLPRMPIGKGSPAMRSLAERLLLTEARIPEARTPDHNPYDVLQARVDRLATGGYTSELADLFGRVSERIDNSRLTRARVDSLLLVGNAQAACDEAMSANQRSDETVWLDVVGFCKAVAGDAPGASLSADLLRDTGRDDPDYFALLSWLGLPEGERGEKPALANDKPLTPLKLAMLKMSGSEVGAATLEAADPMVLVAVAGDNELPGDIRLEAAERAALAGAIGANDLASAYAGATLHAPDLADPITAAASQPGARGNALLYRAAMDAPDAGTRLAVLQAIWQRARAEGTLPLAARVNAEATKKLSVETPLPTDIDGSAPADLLPDELAPPELETPMPAAPDMTQAAPDIIRALLLAGELEAAREWYARIASSAPSDDAASAARDAVWPFMLVADPDMPYSEEALEAWASRAADGDRPRGGALLPAIVEALGHPVPQTYWIGLYDSSEQANGSMPPLPVWRGLVAAGDAGRVGEAVLLCLVVLGDGGPGKVGPAVLADVIKTLRKVKLERDARALALEALIATGL